MRKPFRIGLAGLGIVGAGVAKILSVHKDRIAAYAGRDIEIIAVSARHKDRDRGFDISDFQWFDNAIDLSGTDIDCVVELIGGSDGVAKALAEKTLAAGKHLVTANKALLAHHGYSLALLAEKTGKGLAYEGAVAGGIPVIKALKEGFAANKISAVHGILNGTCNYILAEMYATGRDFSDVLAEAQALGYAEADPAFDIKGIDTAHKLCLLTALAFGVRPDFNAIDICGIEHITAQDIKNARDSGYCIKLLGNTQRNVNGSISQMVAPHLVKLDSVFSHVEGALNAVHINGDFVGNGLLIGEGAGAGPTASAVVADIIDIAKGHYSPVFGIPAHRLDLGLFEPDDNFVQEDVLKLQSLPIAMF